MLQLQMQATESLHCIGLSTSPLFIMKNCRQGMLCKVPLSNVINSHAKTVPIVVCIQQAPLCTLCQLFIAVVRQLCTL